MEKGTVTSMRDLEKDGRTLGSASTRVTLNLSAISKISFWIGVGGYQGTISRDLL